MKQKLLLKPTILVLLIAASLNASAVVKYVRKTGSGSNTADGNTWATGYATLIYAISQLPAGDNTIYMESGTATAPTAAIILPASLTIQGSYTNVLTSPTYDPINNITTISLASSATFAIFQASATTPVTKLKVVGLKMTGTNGGGGVIISGAALGANATIALNDLMFSGIQNPFNISGGGSGSQNTAVTIKDVIISNHATGSSIAIDGGSINIDNIHITGEPNPYTTAFLKLDGGIGGPPANIGSAPINISNSSFCNMPGNQDPAVLVGATGSSSPYVGSSNITITNSYFRNNVQYSSSLLPTSLGANPGANVTMSGVTFYGNNNNGNTAAQGVDIVAIYNATVGQGRFVSIANSTFQLSGPSAYNFVANGGTVQSDTYTFVGTSNSFNNGLDDPGACPTNLIASQILPVTGLALTAQLVSGNPQLNWTTLTESNTSYFAVQSSADGNSFTTIGKVAATGNSNAALNYTFTDNAATSSVMYYRIQTVDKDGAVTYSNTVAVRLYNATAGYKVYPNPVTNLVNIETGMAGSYLVELFTNDGRKIQAANFSSVSGLISLNINRSSIAAGMYVIKTTNTKAGSNSYTTILVK